MKKENRQTKLLDGEVVKKSSMQTVKVRIDFKIRHPKFKKLYTKSRHFLVHNKDNTIEVGNRVQITPGKKISKNKSWYIYSLIK